MAFSTSGAASGAAAGSAFGPYGAIIGGVLGAFTGDGNKQKAPGTSPYIPVNLQDEQKKAIASNTSNLGDIESLVSKYNGFQQDQASSLMEKAMPGYGMLSKKLTDTASGLLDNPYDLPPDVQQTLQRQAAERGISVGTRGQTQGFSLLKDLGVNSLQYGSSRIAQAQGLTGLLASIAPKVNPMSPASFFISPQEQATTTMANNLGKQATEQGAMNAGTAAANYNSANNWHNIADTLQMFGGSFGGGPKNESADAGFDPNPSGLPDYQQGEVIGAGGY